MAKTSGFLFLAVLIALAAFTVGSVITRPGIGISPDSIVYMAAARGITQGHGITMPAANGQDVPLTHFPFFYPFALACLAVFFAHNFFLTAKVLNLLLFAANTILIAGWIFRRTKSLLLAAFSALIGLCALDLLRVYSMAWSEPLFLLLTFGGLLLLDFYIERPAMPLLFCAALLSAAAVLTRYAGIAGVGAGMLIIFFCQEKTAFKKIKESFLFGLVSGLPIALWLLRNFLLTHDATTRKLVFHPVLAQMNQAAQSTLSLWLFQSRLPLAWTVPMGIAIVFFATAFWVRYKNKTLSPHFWLPFIFLLSYIFLMVVIVCFVEAQLLVPDEYDRILCPLHIAFIVTFFSALPEGKWPVWLRAFFFSACLLFSGYFAYASMDAMREFAQEGQQFANASWRNSPTLAYVRLVPSTTHVYTNGRMPIYLYLNRPCFEIPPKVLLSSLQPNPNYEKVMTKIADEVRRKIAIVVDFSIEDLPQFPTPAEWQTRLGKAPKKTGDGVVFVE